MKRSIFVLAMLVFFLCGCKAKDEDGLTLLQDGKYEKAKVAFCQEIQEKKNLDTAYYGAGIACFELGEYREAIGYFELALASRAKQVGTIRSFLGACYMETGDYEKALDAYESALAEPNLSAHLEQEAHYNMIAVYEKLGNWEAAKIQIEKYVKKYPNDSRVEKEQDFLEKR